MALTTWRGGLALAAGLVFLPSPCPGQSLYAPRPGAAGWTVTTDPLQELLTHVNQRARQSDAPMVLKGVGFDIELGGGGNHSYEDREILSEGWALSIANMLEPFGFEVVSDERLRRLTRMSIDQFRDMIIQNQAYGIRDQVARHMGRGIYVLLNERPANCPAENVFVAMVMPYYPVEGVSTDYGSVAVFLLGAGACGSNGRSERRLAEVLQSIIRDFSTSEE